MIKTSNKKLNKLIWYGIITIIILYILSSFYLVFKTDEEVSMGLILKKYSKLVSIDSLDVHPPFYYLCLKIFVSFTTFWTPSIFVKTISARIFSSICLILFIYVMVKILHICNIKVNIINIIILFLIAPGVINESAKIRMYSFAALILALELFELIKFIYLHHNMNIILTIIYAIFATYTFYPLAISAGLFILLTFIIELFRHNKGLSYKLFISGIVIICAYLPWINIVLKQIKIHSSTDGSLVPNYFYIIISSITQINAPYPTSPLLKYTSLVSIIVICLFLLLIIYSLSNLNNIFNHVLLLVLINFIGTLFITVVICKRQFRLTTVYPIYSIFIFLLFLIILHYIKFNNCSRIYNILIVFTLLIFMTYSFLAGVNNIKNYDYPSIRLVRMFNRWKLIKSKDINIDKAAEITDKKGKISGNATYVTQDASYLSSIKRNAIIYVPSKYKGHVFISSLSNDKNNYKLFHKLFPNLKLRK